jgi:hypothetical protein
MSVERRDLQARLDKVESDCRGKDQLLQEARQPIQSANAKLGSTKVELEQVRHELSQLSGEHTALQGRLEEAKCLADAKETNLKDTKAELERVRQELTLCDYEHLPMQIELEEEPSDQFVHGMEKFCTDFPPTDPMMNVLYNSPILGMTESFPETLAAMTGAVSTSLGDLPQGRMIKNFPAADQAFWLSSHEQTLQQPALYNSQAQPGCWPDNLANFMTYGNEQADVWCQAELNLNQGGTLPFQATAYLSV